jgi:hypothetical protein
MNIVVAGASGWIGRALVPSLRAQGHQVSILVRREVRAPEEIAWDPAQRRLAAAALNEVDAVINLAGASIAAERWTEVRKRELQNSRFQSTRTLVDAFSSAPRRPRVLVNISAVGFYGDRGDALLPETAPRGSGFLAELCEEWERAAFAAESPRTRVVCPRLGVVLGRDGGALAQMLPVFRKGLGGRLGSGRAWLSWISLRDVVVALGVLATDVRWRGPVNLVSPAPVTYADFARLLAQALRRPALLPVPAWALKLRLGEMATAMLLASQRAEPAKLLAGGFVFSDPELGPWLQHELR